MKAFTGRKCMRVVAALAIGVGLGGADAPAPYRSPWGVAFAPDGAVLAVTDFTANAVAIIDAASGGVVRSVPLAAGGAGVAWSADGKKLYAVEGGGGCVAEIEAGTWTVARRFEAGFNPLGIAVAGTSLLVTDHARGKLLAIDAESGGLRRTVDGLREPFGVAATPDGRLAVVTNLLPCTPATDPAASCAVSIVEFDGEPRRTDVRLPAGSVLLRGVAVSPDGAWAYVVHTLGRFSLPTTQLDRGWVNTNALSVIDLRGKRHLATMLLDHPAQGAAEPFGAALSRDGATLWISLSGVHRVARVDVAGLHKLLAGDMTGREHLAKNENAIYGAQNTWLMVKEDPKHLELLANDLTALYVAGLIEKRPIAGNGPRGIALSPDEKTLAVAAYFSGQVDFVDTARVAVAKSIPLGSAPPPDRVRRGEMIFHDATYCFQQWLSCATCHPNGGRADGLNWDLLNDGIGNPKNTKSLLYSHETPPAMALGVRASMEVAARAGFVHILFREPSPEELEAVEAYIRSLRPVPSPYRAPGGGLTERARRGKELFESPATRCADCHNGPFLTDKRSYDVGTKGEFDSSDEFDTPTLYEVWRTGPFLHDGSALTLEDVLTARNAQDKHGVTSTLSAEDIAALVEYLLSL
ncbi:MAG: Virginiamycin B lyase [Planctomycetes bacterium ADurb.Bin069]|jgi:DNA-binding beta-propeller fold protein YncE|nr:MAG: Virginiamycin B lyase [Planctomycetes bacterium ADurb.Bin069]